MPVCQVCKEEVLNLQQHYLENMTGEHKAHWDGVEFLNAGHKFWHSEAEAQQDGGKAIRTIKDESSGHFAVFTRGEYADLLREFINMIDLGNPYATSVRELVASIPGPDRRGPKIDLLITDEAPYISYHDAFNNFNTIHCADCKSPLLGKKGESVTCECGKVNMVIG